MDKLISIIVPVYKVEKYLECCLDSLRRQSMQEIEIILIDDASPDRCGEICDSYAARDSRFRVIHRPTNKGLSAARNLGISLASCDYLMFVDSDDWVSEDFCRDAYQCVIQYNADLVMFNYKYIKESKAFPKSTEPFLKTCLTREKAIDLLFTEVKNYAWNKLYHKKLFNGVFYPEGYSYEDIATTYKTVWKASNIYYIGKILYFYRFRLGSICQVNSRPGDWFKMYMLQCKDLWNKGCTSEQFIMFLNKLGMKYCIRNKEDYANPDYAFLAHVLRQNKHIPKGLSWKRKILFVLFKNCPPIFEIICNHFARNK